MSESILRSDIYILSISIISKELLLFGTSLYCDAISKLHITFIFYLFPIFL